MTDDTKLAGWAPDTTNVVRAMFGASVSSLTTSQILRESNRKLDWLDTMKPVFSAIGSIPYLAGSLDRAIAVAGSHPSPTSRSVRLDCALRDIAAMRRSLDELEAAITSARDVAEKEATNA